MAIEIIVKNAKGEVVAHYDLEQIEEAKQHDRIMEAADELFPRVSELPSIKKLDLSERDIEEICIDLLRNQAEFIPLLEKGKPIARRGRRTNSEKEGGQQTGPENEGDNNAKDADLTPGGDSQTKFGDEAA